MHILYSFFVQFMQFPVLDFGLDHSPSNVVGVCMHGTTGNVKFYSNSMTIQFDIAHKRVACK